MTYKVLYEPPFRSKHTHSFFDYLVEWRPHNDGAIGQCQCGQYAIYKMGWKLISDRKANRLLIRAGVRRDDRGVIERGGKQPPNPPPPPKSVASPPRNM